MHKKGKGNKQIMKKVQIYTDGACSGNPGDGGWAAILVYNGHEKEISGFEKNATNNRMELRAAIEALKCLKEPCEAELFSDSAYLVDTFNSNWLKNWKSNEWLKSSKDEVKNIDMWKELDSLCGVHKVKWVKVKGHSDNEYNNRCDRLAVNEIKRHREMQGRQSAANIETEEINK